MQLSFKRKEKMKKRRLFTPKHEEWNAKAYDVLDELLTAINPILRKHAATYPVRDLIHIGIYSVQDACNGLLWDKWKKPKIQE